MQPGDIYSMDYGVHLVNHPDLLAQYEKYFGPDGSKLIFVESEESKILNGPRLIFLNGQGERISVYPGHTRHGYVQLIGPL